MPNVERALLQCCARLFDDPSRLIQSARIAFDGPLHRPAHAHLDLLQLDLLRNAHGSWVVEGRPYAAAGTTAAVFYPGEAHAYALQSGREPGELFSLKIRVEANWLLLRNRIFAPLAQGLTGTEPLVRALGRLSRSMALPGLPSAARISALADVLCLWPRSRAATTQPPPDPSLASDERIVRAMHTIDAQLAQSHGLDRLASAAHLSPRHFARLFRAQAGCTPHAYLDARRKQRAEELLAQGHLNVSQIAEALGFSSIHAFSRWFRQRTGQSPSHWRAPRSWL